MGVEYLHMDGEAEAIASELCRINYVDYVVTEDMDTMAFGCPKLIRTCLDKSIKRNDFISIIDLPNIIKELNLSNEKFIELARSVYKNNDERAKIKLEINNILGSNIKEVKSHF